MTYYFSRFHCQSMYFFIQNYIVFIRLYILLQLLGCNDVNKLLLLDTFKIIFRKMCCKTYEIV